MPSKRTHHELTMTWFNFLLSFQKRRSYRVISLLGTFLSTAITFKAPCGLEQKPFIRDESRLNRDLYYTITPLLCLSCQSEWEALADVRARCCRRFWVRKSRDCAVPS